MSIAKAGKVTYHCSLRGRSGHHLVSKEGDNPENIIHR